MESLQEQSISSEEKRAEEVQAIGMIFDLDEVKKTPHLWGYILIDDNGEHFEIEINELKAMIKEHSIVVSNIILDASNGIRYYKSRYKIKETHSFIESSILRENIKYLLPYELSQSEQVGQTSQTGKLESVALIPNIHIDKADKAFDSFYNRAIALGYSTNLISQNTVRGLVLQGNVYIGANNEIIYIGGQSEYRIINEHSIFAGRTIDLSKIHIENINAKYVRILYNLFSDTTFISNENTIEFSLLKAFSNLRAIDYMFIRCKGIQEKVIDISMLNFSNIKSAIGIFSVIECKEVRLPQIGNKEQWVNAQSMFKHSCIDRLIINSDNLCYISNAEFMFTGATINKLDLSGIKIADRVDIGDSMFEEFKGTLINIENTDSRIVTAYKNRRTKKD